MRKFVYSKDMKLRLYRIREALNLTQAEMSLELGHARAFINGLESQPNGKLTESVALAICAIYGVSYDYLVFGEGPMFELDKVRRKRMHDAFSQLAEPLQECVIDFAEFLLSRHEKVPGQDAPESEMKPESKLK